MKPELKQAYIYDSLQNILTGLGIQGMDKSLAGEFKDTRMTYGELEAAYSSDWLTGKVCDVPPFDMTRQWRKFDGEIKQYTLNTFEECELFYEIRQKVKEALVLSRIYGGAGIVINVDDGNKPWEQLEIEKIKKDGLRWLHVSDIQYLKPRTFSYDPFNKNYGYPDYYSLAPSSVYIHYSRVIRFEPVPLPLAARRRNIYFGKSIIERLYNALKNASSIQDNIANLVYEASVDVIKIPDFMELASTQKGENVLSKRFGAAKLQKSINRLLLLDADEEFESHQQTFNGLQEMMQSYLNIVAGAADIPITRLLGQSPGGLNATGTSDIRNYYDYISGQQELFLRPKIAMLDEIIYRSVFGRKPKEKELSFRFNSLWQMNDKETSEIEYTRAQRDSIYLDRGVIGEAIIANDLMLSNTYSAIDSEYVGNLDEYSHDDDDDEGEDGEDGDGNKENAIEKSEPESRRGGGGSDTEQKSEMDDAKEEDSKKDGTDETRKDDEDR